MERQVRDIAMAALAEGRTRLAASGPAVHILCGDITREDRRQYRVS